MPVRSAESIAWLVLAEQAKDKMLYLTKIGQIEFAKIHKIALRRYLQKARSTYHNED